MTKTPGTSPPASITLSRVARFAARPWRPLTLALVLTAVALGACGSRNQDKAASQTAAKVNKEEITVHQINYVLQQQRGLRPEQADAAGRQVLERLIDQELAVQRAEDLKLDRDPRVVQQLEAARREIVARAYAEKIGEPAERPSAEQIKAYYAEKPALFSQRRIYSFQEISVEARPEQVADLREKLAAAKNIGDFVEYLKANDFRFNANQAVRSAEQLPLANLEAFARMKDGQAIVLPAASGLQVLVLAGSRMQPINEEQARAAIEQFMLNDRKRKLVEADLKNLRSTAKVEYVGKFAEGSGAAASAASAPATSPGAESASAPGTASQLPLPTVAPAPAASGGLSASDISKGMGLK